MSDRIEALILTEVTKRISELIEYGDIELTSAVQSATDEAVRSIVTAEIEKRKDEFVKLVRAAVDKQFPHEVEEAAHTALSECLRRVRREFYP
jgi:predicted dinucleotide-utilizing enzyme